jgi:regulator of replication initiation timing|tara:strand:- start:1321 stop:1542 length:222 start_codon:yes stop_codon:yes gene_type:complete
LTDIKVTEQDLASVLQKKINENTNLTIRIEALERTVTEQATKITQMEEGEPASNGKEASEYATSREEKVPIYD